MFARGGRSRHIRGDALHVLPPIVIEWTDVEAEPRIAAGPNFVGLSETKPEGDAGGRLFRARIVCLPLTDSL